KRRCLYHWIDFPDLEREVEIIRLRAPGVSEALARSVAATVARLRSLDLVKLPGAAEAIDWAQALSLLDAESADGEPARATLGWAVKNREDTERVEAGLFREGGAPHPLRPGPAHGRTAGRDGPCRRVLPRRCPPPARRPLLGGEGNTCRARGRHPGLRRCVRGLLRALSGGPSPACSRSDPRRGRGGDRARQPDRAAAREELRTLLRGPTRRARADDAQAAACRPGAPLAAARSGTQGLSRSAANSPPRLQDG